jgi:hypothetical protein
LFPEAYYSIFPKKKNSETVYCFFDEIQSVTPEVIPEVIRMLEIMQCDIGRREILSRLGLTDEKHFREFYQQPAVAQGLIEMTILINPGACRFIESP